MRIPNREFCASSRVGLWSSEAAATPTAGTPVSQRKFSHWRTLGAIRASPIEGGTEIGKSTRLHPSKLIGRGRQLERFTLSIYIRR
jgi:hypothetical protein